MKKILCSCFVFLALCMAQASHAAWNADWTHRLKLSLNTADDGLPIKSVVDAAPVLIRLHTGNFSFLDAKPDGSDLRFIAGDDKTPLKFHIEKYDGINELALVWVQVPKVAVASKTDFIWLYYGNQNAAAGEDAKSTYDALQSAVFHFGEKEGLPKDATANANTVVRSTATISNSGLIGGALSFDGKNEMAIAASPGLKLTPNGMTVSMWIKPADITQTSTLLSQKGGLSLVVRGDKLVLQAGSLSIPSSASLLAATWQHVAIVMKEGATLYLNGQEAGKLSGQMPAAEGDVVVGTSYVGELDELQVSGTARSADWIRLAAGNQGPDQKLVQYGQAEGGDAEGGTSYMKILLGSLTTDGWVVVGILMVMMVISIFVMINKTLFINKTAGANTKFKAQFQRLLNGIHTGAGARDDTPREAEATYRHSSLHHLYQAGVAELHQRFDTYAKAGRDPILSNQSINAIRATIDARLVREMQRLNSQMVLLTIAIAGGPFLGLLGTVVGVMITFAAIAAAGDVNVNAIAPGIAAALIATVAGLAVAIPALFGYNYLTSKIKEMTSDMQVFVDEFITKIAENYSV